MYVIKYKVYDEDEYMVMRVGSFNVALCIITEHVKSGYIVKLEED